VWLGTIELTDLRNIRAASLALSPGLNVFLGRNAQGKTSILEAVGLLARGRSFRTDQTRVAIRHGAPALRVSGQSHAGAASTALGVEISPEHRCLRVNGLAVSPAAYQGRLEVAVYATDRLRIVQGPMRERRQFLDRSASALWPAYRQLLRDYERVVVQRNAALQTGARDLAAWDERLVDLGAQLRYRRSGYVERLRVHLRAAPEAPERFDVDLGEAAVAPDLAGHRQALLGQLTARQRDERRVRRSLIGPHRDPVGLTIGGEEAALFASAGQARSLLLALTLAVLAVYQDERGQAAVALLDDFDAELDEDRARRLCQELARRGQALITTAQPGWGRRLADAGRVFEVEAGEVRAA
jgi:DNA replication and repair protein RecF